MDRKEKELGTVVIIFIFIMLVCIQVAAFIVLTAWHIDLKHKVESLKLTSQKEIPSAVFLDGDYPQVYVKGGKIIFLDKTKPELLEEIRDQLSTP